MPTSATIISQITPPLLGALLGSGWVQSRYEHMPLWMRIVMFIFTMSCVYMGFVTISALAVMWGFSFPSGMYMFTAFIISVVCIPFAKWLTLNSGDMFSGVANIFVKKIDSSVNKNNTDK